MYDKALYTGFSSRFATRRSQCNCSSSNRSTLNNRISRGLVKTRLTWSYASKSRGLVADFWLSFAAIGVYYRGGSSHDRLLVCSEAVSSDIENEAGRNRTKCTSRTNQNVSTYYALLTKLEEEGGHPTLDYMLT